VVDRHSKDETTQIAREFGIGIHYVTGERSIAKNLGAGKAHGEFVLFVDSDMELDEETIEECVRLCYEKNCGAIVVPLTTVAVGFLAKCRKMEVELYNKDPNFFLMPRFFLKETFMNLGGFDEKLVCGEDFDLARRCEKLGCRIAIADLPIKHLEGKITLKQAVLKAHYYGKTLIPFFAKDPLLTLRGYCPTRFAWNIKRLFRQPLLLAGISIIKLYEYIAYLTGILTVAFGRDSALSG
jgi:glycosyltransferase involved in cell wall biosynthesis